MAKKVQIATGKRGGRIAGYRMEQGKMKPIYVDDKPESGKGRKKGTGGVSSAKPTIDRILRGSEFGGKFSAHMHQGRYGEEILIVDKGTKISGEQTPIRAWVDAGTHPGEIDIINAYSGEVFTMKPSQRDRVERYLVEALDPRNNPEPSPRYVGDDEMSEEDRMTQAREAGEIEELPKTSGRTYTAEDVFPKSYGTKKKDHPVTVKTIADKDATIVQHAEDHVPEASTPVLKAAKKKLAAKKDPADKKVEAIVDKELTTRGETPNIPKKKEHPGKTVTDTKGFKADLEARLKGTGISATEDNRAVSLDGKRTIYVDVIRFQGPGGSIQGYVTPGGTVTLFPPDREYLMVGSGSPKNMDAAARFIVKYTGQMLAPDTDEDRESTVAAPKEGESVQGFLEQFKEKRSKKDRRKTASEKVPTDALAVAKEHLRGGGSRKDLLPKMVEHFGGNAKKARRFIRKLDKQIAGSKVMNKSLSSSDAGTWANAVLGM